MGHDEMTPIEAVRKRPGMYVGSVDESGLITYLLGAIQLLLALRPTRLAFAREGVGYVVRANVSLPVEEFAQERLFPFEEILLDEAPAGFQPRFRGYEGTVLNALSEWLAVEIHRDGETERLAFRRGIRESRDRIGGSEGAGTILRFAPDLSIFQVAEPASVALRSYLRRLSFLHPGARFVFSKGDEAQEYDAPRGLLDLFDAISAPFVLLHEPIHFIAEEGALRLEAVIALQSRREDGISCFINNGFAVAGGTHEDGLLAAFRKLRRDGKRHRAEGVDGPGAVGVVSIQYPDVVWEGSARDRIASPELQEKVRDLFLQRASEWLQNRPDVAETWKRLRTIDVLESWIC